MHDGHPDTCHELCKLLTTFAKFNDKAKEAIFKVIEITYLFSLISKYPDNVPLINQVFGIFVVLNESIRKIIFFYFINILYYCTFFLATIENILVDQCGVIPILINYLKKQNVFELTTPCYLCVIITQLARNDSYRQKLLSEGCMAVIKQFIQSNIKSTILCVCGCSALDSLSKKSQHTSTSKKGHFSGNSGVGLILYLLKTNKYDRETCASIFNSLGFIISMDKEKAYAIAHTYDMQFLLKTVTRFIDNFRISSEFTTLLYNTIKSLVDLDGLKLIADNVESLIALLFQIAKKVVKSTDTLIRLSFILYILSTNFLQSKLFYHNCYYYYYLLEIIPKIDNVKLLINVVRMYTTNENICKYLLSVVKIFITSKY